MAKEDVKNADQLTGEEYSDFIADVEDFEHKFLNKLAGTDKYEIITAIDENGKPYSKEQLQSVKQECLRLGIGLLYKIDLNSNDYILLNPDSMKIGYISDTTH